MNILDEIKHQLEDLNVSLINLQKEIQDLKSGKQNVGQYYTSSEVKSLLGISADKLAQMRTEGKIEFLKLSAFSFRYPSSQPLFSGEQKPTVIKKSRLEKFVG